jgi:hypothetical protein
MEVTCQLRLDQLTKSGQAQIQVTCCWDGQRTKFGSGQKCLPKHWDTKRERVKDKPDSYAEDINQVLDDYVTSAQATYRAAQGQPLPKEQLRAGIARPWWPSAPAGRCCLPWPPPYARYSTTLKSG